MQYHENLKAWASLIETARLARQRAYAPYSNFLVGAAIEAADRSIYGGCNVEIASLGLTCCAERTAIFKMVSENGAAKIKRVCVILEGAANAGGSPCGACRQVIWEFAQDASVPVLMIDPEGNHHFSTIGELLPDAFVLENIQNAINPGEI